MRKRNAVILAVIGYIILIFAPINVLGADPYNYADLWRSWSIVTREAYISGMHDGIFRATSKTLRAVTPKQWEEVRIIWEPLFLRNTRSQICNVITDLYNDPANAFIFTCDMVFLARDKIEGKDITEGIMDARKDAIETHSFMERKKEK
jgi:hypothetical protein